MSKEKTKLYLINSCKVLLLVMAISLFVFALMSGAGHSGILRNIPNSLPWILLIILACLTFRWQILGGVLVILFGIFTILFFSALEFLWILFIISLPLIILGSILVLI
jgi:hypothetical protein